MAKAQSMMQSSSKIDLGVKSTQSSSGEKNKDTEEPSSASALPRADSLQVEVDRLPALYEQHEDVILYYQAKKQVSNCQVLIMGQMKALYSMEPIPNKYARKFVYPWANKTFRFHGKNVMQLSMQVKDIYRIRLGSYKPFLSLEHTGRA